MMLATALVLGTAQVAAAQGGLKAQPNSQKYKNTGAKPATGRSGSASLEARVLIAKDNTMKLEASTAGVEAASHPGTITKMQVKVGPDFTKNYNGLNAGGYWSASLPAAGPLTSIQLQANIKGIDPKRNDVVTISTPAYLRPDVAVTAVTGPQQQTPNTPVTFFGTVKELNGQVGANANCVFSIDGNTIATTPGIWVDAAGTVSCQFQHTFANAGTYTVGVAAAGVNPGDWDTANNSATATITILTPDKKISNGSMSVYQYDYEYLYQYTRSGGYYCQYGYYYYCSYSNEQTRKEHQSNVWMSGHTYDVAANLLQTVSATISTNGSVTDQISMSPMNSWGDTWQRCAEYYGQTYWDGHKYYYPGVYFNMCSYGDPSQPQYGSQTNMWFQRIEGDAVYLNRRTECDVYGNCNTWDDYYWYYNNWRHGAGANFNWKTGDTVRLEIAYVAIDGRKLTADKSVTLLDNGHYNYQDGPYSYWNDWDGNVYYFWRETQKSAYGYINWYNEQ